MIGLGITLTVITFGIIILRIVAEVKQDRFSAKGGIIVALAFGISFIAVVSVALLTSVDSLEIRLSVLGLCIILVFSSYRFAKREYKLNIEGKKKQ